METLLNPAIEEQAKKAAREAQRLGAEVRKDFTDAVSRGKDAAEKIGASAQGVADSARDTARDTMDSARKKVGKAADRVETYADDNTALVAAAAFGIGLLVGYLVSRKA